eukprot:1343888-Amorphochlora_amoeboformis.AAC.3
MNETKGDGRAVNEQSASTQTQPSSCFKKAREHYGSIVEFNMGATSILGRYKAQEAHTSEGRQSRRRSKIE